MRPRRTPEGDRRRIALPTREGTTGPAEVNGAGYALAVTGQFHVQAVANTARTTIAYGITMATAA